MYLNMGAKHNNDNSHYVDYLIKYVAEVLTIVL